MRGRIEDFGLADVFQLIGQNKKTGMIFIESPDDEVEVTVKDGWIVHADAPLRPAGSDLAQRLVRAGLMTREQFGQALKHRAETDEPMANILVTLGIAESSVIHQYTTLQALDTLFQVFTWEAGSYHFEEMQVRQDAVWIQPVVAEDILVRGLRLAEEWPLIQARISSTKMAVETRGPLPPARVFDENRLFDELTNPQLLEDEIGDNERLIHQMCLPGTTVRTILDRTHLDRFETYRCLSTLIGEGVLRLTQPARF